MNRREALQALMSLPATATVTRADVKPHDVIVIESDKILSADAIDHIKANVEMVWPDRKCVVLIGLKLRIVSEGAQ